MIVASHAIQYQAPLFRELAGRVDLMVCFAHRATAQDQSRAGFGVDFEWDGDLLTGYASLVLGNVSGDPGLHRFAGCDTPDIAEQIDRWRPDAVLVMGWHLKSYVQAALAARRRGIPVMVRGDSQLETSRSARLRAGKAVIYPFALRLFSAALYVGERSRAYWRHYHYPAERMFFSPHCVDTGWFAARATPEARRRLRHQLGLGDATTAVLFAGKLVAGKRPLDLVAAAARLHVEGRSIALMIAGAGALAEAIESAARAAGVRCHMLGFCNQSQMPAVYAACDVLVLPSEGETWGLVVNEALACGKPVVVSDRCGCVPDLVADGTTGRSYPMGDIGALAKAIDGVLIDPPSLRTIDATSQAYSVEKAGDGIVAALDACVAHDRIRRGQR